MEDRPIWVLVVVGILWLIAATFPTFFHSCMDVSPSKDSVPINLHKLGRTSSPATTQWTTSTTIQADEGSPQ